MLSIDDIRDLVENGAAGHAVSREKLDAARQQFPYFVVPSILYMQRNCDSITDEEKKENANLRETVIKKDTEIQELESRIKELETRYANLKMARMISVNDNEIRDTKQRLTRLKERKDSEL